MGRTGGNTERGGSDGYTRKGAVMRRILADIFVAFSGLYIDAIIGLDSGRG